MFFTEILFFTMYYLHGEDSTAMGIASFIVSWFLWWVYGIPIIFLSGFIMMSIGFPMDKSIYIWTLLGFATWGLVWLYYRSGQRGKRVVSRFEKHFKRGWGATANCIIVFLLYILVVGPLFFFLELHFVMPKV